MITRGKIELSVTARSLEEIKVLAAAGADAFFIGNPEFAIDIEDGFKSDELEGAVELAHGLGAKVYLLANALYHNAELAGLAEYLLRGDQAGIDGLVFEDPAVYSLMTELGLNLPLHLSSGSMITSSGVVNFWATRGVARATLARELTVEEILAVKASSTAGIDLEVQVYGRTAIFYSRRPLVSSYQEYVGGEAFELGETDYLFLREELRPDGSFPLIQDSHGTHVYSDLLVDLRGNISRLVGAGIHKFKVDGIFMATSELGQLISDLKQEINRVPQEVDEHD